jgi:hypothetical protein
VTSHAVYIGTTAGPVRIYRIINEPVPLSEVFVGRGLEAIMPMSVDYGNFLKEGRPVYRAFGPFENASFRMDLSAPITSGNSWNLSVFIAHGLLSDGQFAEEGDKVDKIFWLTGKMNADCDVEHVGHIPEKLAASESLFHGAQIDKIPVSVFIPSSEIENAKDCRNYMDVIGVDNGLNLAIDLGLINSTLKKPLPASPDVQPAPQRKPVSSKVIFAVIAGVGFGVGAYALNAFKTNSDEIEKALVNVDKKPLTDQTQPQPPHVQAPKTTVTISKDPAIPPTPTTETPTAPPPLNTANPPVNEAKTPVEARGKIKSEASGKKLKEELPLATLKILEKKAPPGKSCIQVEFGNAEPETLELTKINDALYPASNLEGLCSIEYQISVHKKFNNLNAYIEVIDGNSFDARNFKFFRNFSDSLTWTTEIPRRLRQTLRYRVVVEDKNTSNRLLSVAHQIVR